jgi:hypothetical protein
MYLLVTNFDKYWDKIPERKTRRVPSFPKQRIKCKTNNPQENREAIFIKLDATRRIQKGWRGKVFNFRDCATDSGVMEFDVEISQVINPTELSKYEGYDWGWYELTEEQLNSKALPNKQLRPPIFETLEATKDPFEFEDLTHILIRLLGIHAAYKIPRDKQAGRADGIFVLQNLVVSYDCTLSKFEEYKSQQIENFSAQLLRGSIQVPPNIEIQTSNPQKQVWIITKGASRTYKEIISKGRVSIKEIAIMDLLDLYEQRLRIDMSADDLENHLRNLGQS